MIKAKTDTGIIVYFANLTNTQFGWDIDPYYAAYNINESIFHFIKCNVKKRNQIMFDKITETYLLPINIVEMEYINNGN